MVKLLIKQVVIFIMVKQLAKPDKKYSWTTPAEFPSCLSSRPAQSHADGEHLQKLLELHSKVSVRAWQ